ncbi:hypothetical protein ILUMI_00236 [Ignelater luminosus]|uniref:Uncharacterized protein n=1 Tax=Ignelater luminosus TaxID=2038154 RepID=A0A8K0GNA7_IGNLU|nr:hypothetical protein ILUMI_00236 [Ignelater luminosus]
MPYTRDQRNEITDIIQETICALVNDKSFLQKISERIWTKFEQKMEDKYQEIQHKTSVLQEENEKLQEDLDRLEQYTRRNNIRIFGVKQEENENVLEKGTTCDHGFPNFNKGRKPLRSDELGNNAEL